MDIIQGRRSYYCHVLNDPSGKFVSAHLVGGAGVIAQPGEVKAECLYRQSADVGTCLQTGCGCGHNISKHERPHNSGGGFLAQVIGWGKFIEGENGWRTEYMEIIGITCPPETSWEVANALSAYYDCPVQLEASYKF